MYSYQHFQRELDNIILQEEEELKEVIILAAIEPVNFLGIQILRLEPKQRCMLPYFIAAHLVRINKAKWADNDLNKLSFLNKLVNLFGNEQRSLILQKLDELKLSNLYLITKELFKSSEDQEVNLKIQTEIHNLISQRSKKILAKLKVDDIRELKKKMDPLEKVLIDQIILYLQLYEQFFQIDILLPENT